MFPNFWVLGFSTLILCLGIIIIWTVILWESPSECCLDIKKDSSKRLEGRWRTQTEITKRRTYEADQRVYPLVAVHPGPLSLLSSGCLAQPAPAPMAGGFSLCFWDMQGYPFTPVASTQPKRGREGGQKPRCPFIPSFIQEPPAPDTDLSTS